jgi:hypothetical protein
MRRFSTRKIVPLDDRSDVYRKRAKLTIKYKPKPESRSPEHTSATFLNTVGNYVSSDLDSIVPAAASVNSQYNTNDYLPEGVALITDAEYVRPPTIIEKMRTLIGRPKTHPRQSQVYVLVNKRGGKTRRKKNLRKRSRGGTRNSR